VTCILCNRKDSQLSSTFCLVDGGSQEYFNISICAREHKNPRPGPSRGQPVIETSETSKGRCLSTRSYASPHTTLNTYVMKLFASIHCLFILAATATNQKPCPPSGHPHPQQRRRRSRNTVLGHRDASSTHAITWNQS
jgi:hypothetical protein